VQYTFQADTQSCTLRFRSEPKLKDGVNFLWAAIIFVFFCAVARKQFSMVVEGALFALALILVALHRMFSISSLTITSDSLILNRRMFGISRTRTFPKSEVERLGYEPEFRYRSSHQDSALAIMVRDDIMPVRFAQTLLPADAEAIFVQLKECGSWVAELIRPVGTPMF